MTALRKSVECFELAAFDGDRGINRRATRIQMRRDALLLRGKGGTGDFNGSEF